MDDRFVFFDLGNVLVHFDHEIAVRQLASLMDRPADQVRQVVFGSGLEYSYELGDLTCAEFANVVAQELRCVASVDATLESFSAIFEPNRPIEKLLERLAALHVPMGILSNTCKAHWDWLARTGWRVLDGWFEAQVLSYEVRSMKPQSEIYEYCEELVGFSGEEIFFRGRSLGKHLGCERSRLASQAI